MSSYRLQYCLLQAKQGCVIDIALQAALALFDGAPVATAMQEVFRQDKVALNRSDLCMQGLREQRLTVLASKLPLPIQRYRMPLWKIHGQV